MTSSWDPHALLCVSVRLGLIFLSFAATGLPQQARNRAAAMRLNLAARFAPAQAVRAGSDAQPPQSKINFQHDIEPIFQASCVACHGAEKPLAQLRLDSETAVLRGSISGKVVVPGDAKNSLLVKRLIGADGVPRMPLVGDPLPPAQIDKIRAWIDQSAPAPPREVGAAEPAAGGTPELSGAAKPETPPREAAESPVFATRIRPILAARCYQCHGSDAQQNGLRLDSLAAILEGSANGRVVVPGDSEKSRLVRRLMGLERPQMPYGGPFLSEDEIKLIRGWIDQGAPGPDSPASAAMVVQPAKHWAYVLPVRPPLPEVKNRAWCRNPIDHFVLARLEKEGLQPSPEADKETLIRRVSLDLIGLPPTIEEVDAFLADKNPDAYEKLADRLLASPHYGERWARPWLDLSRYGDSNGYEKDNLRTAWEFRDWVINALNQDMSFKEFTIEQIAGDMLPHPSTEQLIATGFHRNTLLNQEGGVDKEEARFETLVDRVNTTAAVWLGSTLGCAQCHNHKFDPFTQKDYYRMMAFFDSNANYKLEDFGGGEGFVWEPSLELPTPDQAKQAQELRAQISQLQKVLDTSTPEIDAAQATWEQDLLRAEKDWSVLRPSHAVSQGGATLKLLEDQSVLATGKNPSADSYTVETQTDQKGITGMRLEVMPDASLPQGGPGRDPDGNFFLSAFDVEAAPAGDPKAFEKVVFKEAATDESQGGYDFKNILSKEPGVRGWAIDTATAVTLGARASRPLLPSSTPDAALTEGIRAGGTPALPGLIRRAVLVPEKPFGFDGGTVLRITLKHEMRHATRNIGRFRLSVTTMPDSRFVTQVPARLRPVLETPAAQRTADQKEKLAAVYRSVSPLLQPTRDQMAKLKKSLDDVGIVTALTMGERESFERPYTWVRARGSFSAKGDQVYAGVPAVLHSLPPNAMPNRLGLAYWLVDDNNPLTARVTVNRYWQEMFGHGIVETAEDFGTQGDAPTHPELLDWLATQFVRDGWSMKRIKRLIVTSATYRQSSRVTPELEERDSYNKLLARGPRFRVEAEMVRDMALAASGLLSPKIGGPSVFPSQPEGVWDRPYSDAKWVESKGEDRYRRGIYVFVRRTSPYPSLTTFDAPSREFCTVRRTRTNTPLQALTTLNDPVYFEAAQALAQRMMKDVGPDEAARATYGFRRALTRHATPPELDKILTFYRQQLDRFRNDTKAAAEVVKGYGDPSLNVSKQAAWTMVANVMLNLDEAITKE
ncbi:MAG: DUF1553 domain-containing protein [Terriglobia bacterium]